MRVLFLKPNDHMVTEENGTINYSKKILPYSIAVCASALRDNYEADILDAGVEDLKLLETINRIKEVNPDVLVINLNVIAIDIDMECMDMLKKETNCKITALINLPFAKEVIERYPIIDVVIEHDWAWALLDVIKCFENKGDLNNVKGITFGGKGSIVETEMREHIQIDELPLPALDLLPMKEYEGYAILMTAGCQHHCIFCHFGSYPPTGWESNSIDKIISEIKLMLFYGNKPIRITDNETTLNIEFAKELCKRLFKENLNANFDGNTRGSTVDEELPTLLSKAGFRHLGMGVESCNQKILDLNKKDLVLEDVIKAVNLLNKCNISVKTYFLIGLLGDTEETIRETFEFINSNKLSSQLSSFDIVVPYPRTVFFDILKENGWIDDLTIDNLIWIYKNLYGWNILNKFEGEKPKWRIGDLTFDALLKLEEEYYQKVKNKGEEDYLRFFIKREFLHNPLSLLLRVFQALILRPKDLVATLKKLVRCF